jgi:hypothetical protein
MKRPHAPRGGILLDLFLIGALCAGGGALWLSRSRWAPTLRGALPGGAAATPATPAPENDLGGRAAATQGWVRVFLTEAGVGDADVLKAYNAERRAGDAVWVESTLEIRARRGFSSGRFLARLAPRLHRERLAVLADTPSEGRWLLELGEGRRVYQRLIFHLS